MLYCGVDDSNPVWTSRTYNKGRPPYRLVVQADNRLCLYSGDNNCVWASGTLKVGVIVQSQRSFNNLVRCKSEFSHTGAPNTIHNCLRNPHFTTKE